VGNAPSETINLLERSVHPHARGERSDASASHGESFGSSPRPWGTPSLCLRPLPGPRFIPTPVGNAERVRPLHPVESVHPHARGERPWISNTCISLYGSSPRPWGTPVGTCHHRQWGRFIPTPVGNAPESGERTNWDAVHPHARGERF